MYTLAGLAVLGGTIYAGKKSMKSLPEALEKRGVEIKNGIAYLKGTDHEFTGFVKRNIMPFGLDKEKVVYINGKLSEVLQTIYTGKERWGEFYIDGELFLNIGGYHVGTGCSFYSINKFEKDPLNVIHSSCFSYDVKCSIFTVARKLVQEKLRELGKRTKS